jgi:hypothetical protein
MSPEQQTAHNMILAAGNMDSIHKPIAPIKSVMSRKECLFRLDLCGPEFSVISIHLWSRI